MQVNQNNMAQPACRKLVGMGYQIKLAIGLVAEK